MCVATLFATNKYIGAQMLLATLLATNKFVGEQIWLFVNSWGAKS